MNIDLLTLLYQFNATPNLRGPLRTLFTVDDCANCSGFHNLLQSLGLLSIRVSSSDIIGCHIGSVYGLGA